MDLGKVDQAINRHKNKPALIVGHGPSLNNYLDKIRKLKQDHIIFGCNEWFNFYDTPPQYGVIIQEFKYINLSRISNETQVFYSKDVNNVMMPSNFIEINIHHDNENRLQNKLKKYTNNNERYGTGASVILHMIALSILMGCNPIKIVGMDLDYSKGYARNKLSNYYIDWMRVNEPSVFEPDRMLNIISDLKIIHKSAKNINVKLIDLGHRKGDFFT